MLKYLFLIGSCYFIYKHSYKITRDGYFYYTSLINSFKQGDYIKTNYELILANTQLYSITLSDGKEFLVKDINIDTNKYELLKGTFTIPHVPDDILEATIVTSKDKTIDVDIHCKIICGPLMNQFTEDNKSWLFEYIKHALDLTEDIKELNVTYINNHNIKLVLT